jgi:sugar-specific transcriptional regulator TrmB
MITASDLETLGLTQDEATIFLSTLELGGGYASTIAQKSKIPRVNTYHVLEKLIKKELITPIKRGKVKFFMPEPPQVLINQQEEKFRHAKQLLPELLSITNTHPFKPKIQAFEGINDIKQMLTHIYETQGEVVGYTNMEALGELIKNHMPAHIKKSLKSEIKRRMLSPKSQTGMEFTKNYYPPDLTEILFINPEAYPFENDISIYGNFVSIISLNPQEPIGVLIESEAHAHTQRSIFNLAWLGATSFVAQN